MWYNELQLLTKVKVGSKFVERGDVYQVYKVDEKKVYYRPFFAKTKNNSYTCSIPRENLGMINIRKPIIRNQLNEILRSFSKKSSNKADLDVIEAKSVLDMNQIEKSSSVVRKFWRAKERDGDGFTRAKNEVLKLAISRIVEEVALVSKSTPEKAEERIRLALS